MLNNVRKMAASGYCTSPNNIWNLPGVVMYAAGAGIMEPQDARMLDINVDEHGVRLVRSIWNDGKFQRLEIGLEFSTVEAYLQWVAVNGAPSLPGLPAYNNSWD
jgi:hypothetical protein